MREIILCVQFPRIRNYTYYKFFSPILILILKLKFGKFLFLQISYLRMWKYFKKIYIYIYFPIDNNSKKYP